MFCKKNGDLFHGSADKSVTALERDCVMCWNYIKMCFCCSSTVVVVFLETAQRKKKKKKKEKKRKKKNKKKNNKKQTKKKKNKKKNTWFLIPIFFLDIRYSSIDDLFILLKSIKLRCRELILRNLPSNIMRYSR